ncbi:hypothetical protein SLA2020_482620 [Shorea laevis]
MKNGCVQEAQNLFDKMPQRNTVTWNAMVRGYFLNGFFDKALCLFHQMPERDIFSYNTVISGLMQCGDVDRAREIFDGMMCRDVVTWNSMISGYVSNGLVEEARRVFDEMPVKNVISWNLVLGALVNSQRLDLAEDYFRNMNARDVASWTIMISGLVRTGRIAEARQLFEEMPVKDVQAWNAMLAGYVENECVDMAEMLFGQMPDRDLDSWKLLISGLVSIQHFSDATRYFMEMPTKCHKTCNLIQLGLIRKGLVKEAHAFSEKVPYNDLVSWTNMIVGYFEIGEIGNAVKLFELMPIRDTTVWNVMIFGLGENDHGEEGLKVFIRMKESGQSPDEATFTSVLTICSNLPTFDFGKQSHAHVIKSSLDLFTAVSNAMVTMYARCGNMHSALLEFSAMPFHDIISWNSVICGLAHNSSGEKAVEMFEQMRLTDVKPNHITFIGVLSACSHSGLVDEGKYYFDYMKNKCFLEPTSEHYTCIVDLLGRFGLIDEAMNFLNQMRRDGVEVPASVWGALLGACRIHKNIEVGEIVGERVLEMEPDNSGVYLILAEMYLTCGRREDAERIRARMKENGTKKQPGCSWTEVNNSSQVFLSGDRSHPEFSQICCVLDLLHCAIGIEILRSHASYTETSEALLDGC